MTQPNTPKAATARSPLAGCAILITVGLMVVFLVVFSVASFFRQAAAIAKFTDEKPAPVAITSTVGKESDIQALNSRLTDFQQVLDHDQPATLALSADDLNLAIAVYEPFKDLRGNFRVTEITNNTLKIAISYQMNGQPRLTRKDEPGLITSDFRYLNANLVARPALDKNEVSLTIDDVTVPGKAVPPEFIMRFSPYQIAQRYLTHPVMGPVMKKLTRVEISNGQLVFKRIPGETQADTITHAQVDSASSRLFRVFGIVATVFLIFVAILIFVSQRKKNQETEH